MYLTKDYVYESSMEFLNWDLIFQHMKNIHDENNFNNFYYQVYNKYSKNCETVLFD